MGPIPRSKILTEAFACGTHFLSKLAVLVVLLQAFIAKKKFLLKENCAVVGHLAAASADCSLGHSPIGEPLSLALENVAILWWATPPEN